MFWKNFQLMNSMFLETPQPCVIFHNLLRRGDDRNSVWVRCDRKFRCGRKQYVAHKHSIHREDITLNNFLQKTALWHCHAPSRLLPCPQTHLLTLQGRMSLHFNGIIFLAGDKVFTVNLWARSSFHPHQWFGPPSEQEDNTATQWLKWQ